MTMNDAITIDAEYRELACSEILKTPESRWAEFLMQSLEDSAAAVRADTCEMAIEDFARSMTWAGHAAGAESDTGLDFWSAIGEAQGRVAGALADKWSVDVDIFVKSDLG